VKGKRGRNEESRASKLQQNSKDSGVITRKQEQMEEKEKKEKKRDWLPLPVNRRTFFDPSPHLTPGSDAS
jgi:hypothetical protein